VKLVEQDDAGAQLAEHTAQPRRAFM
jgi:hypothetical protein